MNNKEAAVQEALGVLDLHAIVNKYNNVMVGVFSCLEKARSWIKARPIGVDHPQYHYCIYKYELDIIDLIEVVEYWELEVTKSYKWKVK
ncbi:hypothetical protein LCGC14_2898290 [marine sediment metagenome]|uniref:Uncharacterized protein n=1 Tax=marine sediment metagenome TaxID=412755 RepID=A0A0F9A331_9ZZZZ